jgi:ribose transport system permease protein
MPDVKVIPVLPADEQTAGPRAWSVGAELAPPLVVLACATLLLFAMKVLNPGGDFAGQVTAVLVTSIFLMVASFGQGLTILLGGIDLSIGVVMGISGMMIAGLTSGSNDALLYAVPATLACCVAIGAINGVGIALCNIPPFIMTLSSATAFFGVALGLTAGSSQQPVAPALQLLMSGRWLGVPYPVFLIAAFLLMAMGLQNGTAEGRKLYAIGSSPGAARVLGLPISALTIMVYAISGLCAGIAGLLLAGYSSSATLDMGDSYLMPTVAAVVIGGGRVTGGKGLYLGTFAGALFLSALETIITVLSLSQGLRDIIQGTIIVVALLLQGGRWTARGR